MSKVVQESWSEYWEQFVSVSCSECGKKPVKLQCINVDGCTIDARKCQNLYCQAIDYFRYK